MEWRLEFCWPWLSFVRKYASWWTALTKHACSVGYSSQDGLVLIGFEAP